jgi:hypothetical protein
MMRRLWFLLLPAMLLGGPARYARLGEFDGQVEVQLTAADSWTPASRNLPLLESTWIRTGPASKVEIEFEDGGALRLAADSLAELSDLSRLSTAQRVTLLSLDRGVAYFTGQPEGKDALTLGIPGAQVTVRRGTRIRLEASADWSQVSVIEGAVRFSSPAAEFDLTEGQTARVEPSRSARFFLYREVAELPMDRWNEQRDKIMAAAASGRHVPVGYGLADLDAAGEWVQSGELGAVWKPKIGEGWIPYRDGRWQWYDTLGYTWISAEPWGWVPYHHGRFLRHDSLGWIWVPGKSAVFKPGDVYWLRGAKLAGWGPLAPGETWTPGAAPRQFLNVHTTWAEWQQDARVIDPAGFTARPREPLGAAAFALALPSPAFPAARLDVPRPVLRVGATRIQPAIPGVNYGTEMAANGAPAAAADQPANAQQPVAIVTNPASLDTPVVIVDQPPPPPPQVVEYPVPVYTGIVVVNPPERGEHRRRPGRQASNPTPSQPTKPSEPDTPPARSSVRRDQDRTAPARQAVTPTVPSTPPPVRTEPPRQHQERPAPPATPTPVSPTPTRNDRHHDRVAPSNPERAPERRAEKPAEKPADKPAERAADKPADTGVSPVVRRK